MFWTVPEQHLHKKKILLAEIASVSNSGCLKALCVGVVVVFVIRLICLFLVFTLVLHMTTAPSHKKDAPGRTSHHVQFGVSKKALCVGVTADSVIRLFLPN